MPPSCASLLYTSLYEPSVSMIEVTLVTEVSSNSVLGATPSLHSAIVDARCGSFKYANASCGWRRYPSFLRPNATDQSIVTWAGSCHFYKDTCDNVLANHSLVIIAEVE